MKYFTLLGLMGICAIGSLAAVLPHNSPAVGAVITGNLPVNTLAQDLDELRRLVPLYPVRQLITRYLLNDAEFQTFVRIINSNDAYVTQMRFRTQPEVTNLLIWLRTQILMSGGDFLSDESEELLGVVNRNPFWTNSVSGWQGFVNEFQMYYPQETIRVYKQSKVAENGVIGELIQRLMALKPVYDRVTALPEAQRVAAALQANGIDVDGLDTFIRNQFGWQHLTSNTSSPASSSTGAAVV